MLPPGGYSAPTTSFYQPPGNPNAAPYAIQLPASGLNPNEYYLQMNAIRMAVPNLLSLLAGVIGGWLTLWISRQARSANANSTAPT